MTCLLARTHTQTIWHKFSVLLFVHRRHGASIMTIITLKFYFLLSFLLGIVNVHMFHDAACLLHPLCKAKWFFFRFRCDECVAILLLVLKFILAFSDKKLLLIFIAFSILSNDATQHTTLYGSLAHSMLFAYILTIFHCCITRHITLCSDVVRTLCSLPFTFHHT